MALQGQPGGVGQLSLKVLGARCKNQEFRTDQEVLVPQLFFAVLTPAGPFHLGRRRKRPRNRATWDGIVTVCNGHKLPSSTAKDFRTSAVIFEQYM